MAADGTAYSWGGGRERPMDVSGFVSDLMTDWEQVRKMADEARAVARWAISEEQQTPWWRLLRRRYLASVVSHMADVHKALVADLDAAEKRRATVAATTRIGGDVAKEAEREEIVADLPGAD
jgi:hypothetical protein